MVDCTKCKYYHQKCDAKFMCRIDVEKIRAEARAEIHTALINEMAVLNEVGLTENNLKTFAYRVKDICEQIEEEIRQQYKRSIK